MKQTADRRIRNHVVLGIANISILGIASMAGSDGAALDRISIVSAYQCLFLMAIALLLGPLSVHEQGKFMLNSHSRRDIGIWAGLIALLHFWLGNRLSMNTEYLGIFVDGGATAGPSSVEFRNELYMWGTIFGYLVAVFIVIMLSLSNDWSLRTIGAVWWKRLQRLAYLMFTLTILHALAFQWLEDRPVRWALLVGMIAAFVAAFQLSALIASRNRR